MPHTRVGRGLAVVLASALTLLVTTMAGMAPSDAVSKRVGLPGSKPTWATPAHAAGKPAATTKVSVRVLLKLRQGKTAERLAKQVSDPKSKDYGHYLSPRQFTARFAPSQSAVDQVQAFLARAGISVTDVAEGNRWVAATGTVAQLNSAFNVSLKTYRWKGHELRAPASTASVPASLAEVVSAVTGLTEKPSVNKPMHVKVAPARAGLKSAKRANSAAPSATEPRASECSDYWGQHQQKLPKAFGRTKFNTFICGYAPAQLRKAYGTSSAVSKGVTGKGVTVAIIDAYASPTILADANAYSKLLGEPKFKSGQLTQTVFKPFDLQDACAGEEGWNGEQTLDVEAVHAMAPGAKVHYVGAKNCDAGIDDALNYVVQHHTADVVSNSYGNQGEAVPAAEIALEHSIFVQAAIEGIGMYFSSGDDGDEVVAGLSPQPEYPASDPLVTAVGGTALLLSKKNNRVAETGWETTLDFVDYSGKTAAYASPLPGDFYGGAGGGASTIFRQPYYQAKVVPTALATQDRAHKMRVVPDISALADPYTGFYVGQTLDGAFEVDTIGGTSLAAPLVAGIQALASQHRQVPIGFANPLLYSLPKSAFHDTMHKNLHFAQPRGDYIGSFDLGSTQVTKKGYDNTTGRGTPNGSVLLRAER